MSKLLLTAILYIIAALFVLDFHMNHETSLLEKGCILSIFASMGFVLIRDFLMLLM